MHVAHCTNAHGGPDRLDSVFRIIRSDIKVFIILRLVETGHNFDSWID